MLLPVLGLSSWLGFRHSLTRRVEIDYSRLTANVQRTVYPNGLVLLTREVHAAPVLSVCIYYRVGSRDDPPGEHGISHLVEHMMFRGTSRLAPGEINRLFSQVGGTSNAGTGWDTTEYYETVPRAALEMVLQIEADRMEHSAMAPAELAREKRIVAAEYEQSHRSPVTQLAAAVSKTAFRVHPYARFIGTDPAEVARLTPGQVRDFYHRYYAPNNAVLVVVGDFNTAILRKLVGQDFAQDRPGRIPSRPAIVEPRQTSERRVVVPGAGQTTWIEMAFPVPQPGVKDHTVLAVLATLLAYGHSSRLFRAIGGVSAETIGATESDHRDPYLLTILAMVAQHHTPQQVERAIVKQIARLQTDPVSTEELDSAVNQLKAGLVYAGDSTSGQANQLGYYATIANYRYPSRFLNAVESVTPTDIRNAARRWLNDSQCTVGWFEPAPVENEEKAVLPPGARGAEAASHRVAAIRVAANRPAVQTGSESSGVTSGQIDSEAPGSEPGEAHRPGLLTGFEAPPPLSLAAPIQHAPVTRRVLANGLVVLAYPNHSNPDVSVCLSFRAGANQDPPGLKGLSQLTVDMPHLGTVDRTEGEIAKQLASVGASITFLNSESDIYFYGRCLTPDLPLLLNILSDEIMHPRMRERDLTASKRFRRAILKSGESNPEWIAWRNLNLALYPQDSPLHWASEGTPASYDRITLDDVRGFHERYYRPDLAAIAIVGDIDTPAAVNLAQQFFSGWVNGPSFPWPPANAAGTAGSGGHEVYQPVPGSSDSVVYMGAPGLRRDDPQFDAAFLANLILASGDFNSRLMQDLRERQGIVYGLSGQLDAGRIAGPWTLRLDSDPANTRRMIASTIRDIRAFDDSGPTSEEMMLFKSALAGSSVRRLEADGDLAENLVSGEQYGLGANYRWSFASHFSAISATQVRAAARRLFQPLRMVISIAGAELPGQEISGGGGGR